MKIKSSSTPRILLTCKFACRKLAKRFYRTCVEHHIFFKMHQNRSFLSNTIKEQPLKPQSLILPTRQNLRIGDESNPSVSINGPCSIDYLSVSDLQSPKLPTTPTRSESEIAEFMISSNTEVNHEFPTPSIRHSQVDIQPQVNLYTIEKTYSTEHLVPSTSYAPSARNASYFQLDTNLGSHITSPPLECSSRVNILNVTAEDDHYRSPEIQFCECMHISEELNLNPEDHVHQSTSTPANTQLSFSLDDDAVNDSLLMPPENSNFESSSNEVCETLLNCRISNMQSVDTDPINCDSCLPTGVGHCLPTLQNVSTCTPSSQITTENPIDPLWFNVYPSIDFKLLDRIISPTYRSIISPNGQIIRLTSVNDPNHAVRPSASSTLPCSFLHLNSNDKEAASYFPIPIVQTRAVRFVYDPSLQINEYKTFSNSQIHLVCANDIPLVSTKFFYHH
ncbi:unnamed protein product [Trichobilharzia szidati]|nr:unnamed protein product [Trichobilharzia szidati]CAH8828274.1 unnamed protein product [Trichobilharzia szidati]CAH8828280.1 unnamed protein product [Trichobilharzia szidati]CAH8828283.1 unnamed protein product [Trichobilharzia szidati]